MAEASEKPTLFEPPIPRSEAVDRLLKIYPLDIVKTKMRRAHVTGEIPCGYRELIGHHPPNPTPDMPAFWRSGARGQVVSLTPFPWTGDWVRRQVFARNCRGPLSDCIARGLTVMWRDVVKTFPDAAEPPRRKRGAKSVLDPEQISRVCQTYQHLMKDSEWTGKKPMAVMEQVKKELSLTCNWQTVRRALLSRAKSD